MLQPLHLLRFGRGVLLGVHLDEPGLAYKFDIWQLFVSNMVISLYFAHNWTFDFDEFLLCIFEVLLMIEVVIPPRSLHGVHGLLALVDLYDLVSSRIRLQFLLDIFEWVRFK